MSLMNTKERFGSFHIFLHWLIGLMIVCMLGIGLYMKNTTFNPALYGLHKSFGVVVFALIIVRVIWKFINIMPQEAAGMSKILVIISKLGHLGLYGFLIAMPLSGMLLVLFKGYPISVFGIFAIPPFVANKSMGHFFEEAHEVMAFLFIALILVHVIMVLVHHFILKDNTLRKMLPECKRN